MLGRLIPVINNSANFLWVALEAAGGKRCTLDSEGSLPGILVQPPGLKTKFKESENKF